MREERYHFELPGKVVSQKNSKQIAFAGRRPFVRSSDAVEAWHAEACLRLRGQAMRCGPFRSLGSLEDELEIGIKVKLETRRGPDLDNAIQAPLDALQKAGVIADDRFVTRLSASLERVSQTPGYEIEVVERSPDMGCDKEKKGKGKGKGK